MKLGDPKYILQINIDNRDNELSYVFIHYNQEGDRITTLSTAYLKTFDIFCDRVNEYLDKLEAINHKPKYKVGDKLTGKYSDNILTIIQIYEYEKTLFYITSYKDKDDCLAVECDVCADMDNNSNIIYIGGSNDN
jgi:hypothetical protein